MRIMSYGFRPVVLARELRLQRRSEAPRKPEGPPEALKNAAVVVRLQGQKASFAASLWFRIRVVSRSGSLASLKANGLYRIPIHAEMKLLKNISRRLVWLHVLHSVLMLGVFLATFIYPHMVYFPKPTMTYGMPLVMVLNAIVWMLRARRPLEQRNLFNRTDSWSAEPAQLPLQLAYALQKVYERLQLLEWVFLQRPPSDAAALAALQHQRLTVLPQVIEKYRSLFESVVHVYYFRGAQQQEGIYCQVMDELAIVASGYVKLTRALEDIKTTLAQTDQSVATLEDSVVYRVVDADL